jgi:hypothetical protein
MDLNYQATGSNKHRLCLLNSVLGTNTVKTLALSNVFTICCDEQMSNKNAAVWWTETVKSNTSDLISQGQSYLQEYPNLKFVVLEHGKTIDTIKWFLVVARDDTVRTFQTEADVCQFLQTFAAKQS